MLQEATHSRKRFMLLLLQGTPTQPLPNHATLQGHVSQRFSQQVLTELAGIIGDREWSVPPGVGPILLVVPWDKLHVAEVNAKSSLRTFLATQQQQVRNGPYKV
jgi:hypothetical protein